MRTKRSIAFRVFTFVAGILALIVLACAILVVYNTRDRHRGYAVDLERSAPADAVMRTGFAARKITPDVVDVWTDANGNFMFDPGEGDSWEDVNGNGRFDAVWMAGFQNSKPAQGVHDDLWARAMVLDDGQTRLAWVVLDAIGFFGCDVIDVRKALPADLAVDYLIVSSTHTHSAPDLLGLWGPGLFKSGVEPQYKRTVKDQAVAAVRLAVDNLRPSRLRFASEPVGAAPMIADTRLPVVVNPELTLMQALDIETGVTLGTLVVWGNHPETIWSSNLLITSDYPHTLRDGIENGIRQGDSLITPGLGGVAIFATGNIGGLMTTSPDVPIPDPFSDTLYSEPSFDKVRAQGLALAQLALDALRSPDVTEVDRGGIDLRARTILLPIDNNLFRIALSIGLFDRGLAGWMKGRSEIASWRVGPADFLHHPGELYPEIADGGIEAPDGQDFRIGPVEVPPIRSQLPGPYRFFAGLSNDMIGYVIPKSQWDAKPPHTHGDTDGPYGEINSLGPETAPILHAELMRLLKKRGPPAPVISVQ